MIDLLGDGFRFSSGTGGVDFDLLREGYLIRVSWTEVGTDDVFLVRDLGSDGLIAHGGELFGDRTAQPKTDELNGYNALSQYDTEPFRGNGDGKIDAEDVIYDNLWVWHDRNHDGFSSWDELYTLEQAGIDAIYLDYWRSKERDRHGNESRYFGRVCLSPREGTLASRLLSEGSPREPEAAGGYVLDPLKHRVESDPSTLTGTECEGSIVQSTDVFFVDGY